MDFEFRLPPKIVFGWGKLDTIGSEAGALGRKAMLITGKGSMAKYGVLERAKNQLRKAGVATLDFSGVEEDPCLETVDRLTAEIQRNKCDLVIGIGGGSCLDAAKASSGMATQTQGEKVRDYLDFSAKKLDRPGIFFIAVPATAGTGTEVTKNSVLKDVDRNIKISLRSQYLIPTLAIVDPELTLTVPPAVTAPTGMDALTHAVEAYVSLGSEPVSDVLAEKAIHLIGEYLPQVYKNGKDKTGRIQMMLASLLAGMAFANAGLGASHALSHPVGARFKVPHGVANALLLPAVLEFNRKACPEKMKNIARLLNNRNAAQAVRKLNRVLNLPEGLSDYGIKETDIPGMTDDTKLSGAVKSNPRQANPDDLAWILKKSL